MEKISSELVVIGAGPGGYPAAFMAADKGLNVTLIDKNVNPGGVCLYKGCIPTKSLLHITEIIREAKKSSCYGVSFPDPEINIDKIRGWKNSVVNKMTAGLGQLCRNRNINYIQGHAEFVNNHALRIKMNDNSFVINEFDKCIISVGSSPTPLPNISIQSQSVMYSDRALELEEIPETLLVIGGGYIGLEMGTIYFTLGSKVTIVEMMNQILPDCDKDLVRTYSMTARKHFSSILTNTLVVDIKETKGGINVTFKDCNDKLETKFFNKVLISIGRSPNTDHLGLEKTKIKLDEKGFIEIDSNRRTSELNIYAIGDAVGGVMLAHKATHEAKTAVETIIGNNRPFNPKAIPGVLFTDPEVAWCGLTEVQAENSGADVKVVKFPWGASGRASSLGRMDGLTKLIIDKKSEIILGVGITGINAGELISEGALAVENQLKVSELANTIHPHPTLSETLMEAAEIFYDSCIHIFQPKKL